MIIECLFALGGPFGPSILLQNTALFGEKDVMSMNKSKEMENCARMEKRHHTDLTDNTDTVNTKTNRPGLQYQSLITMLLKWK